MACRTLLVFLALAVSSTASAFCINTVVGGNSDRVDIATSDSVTVLNEVVVTGKNDNLNPLSGSPGRWMWDLDDVSRLPSVLNTGDLLGLFKYLPNVQTSSALNGGLNVDGCDNSQTLMELDGMPVFNTTHLLGLFSTLNSSHFSKAVLDMYPSISELPHIGGSLSVSSSDVSPGATSGNVSIGLLFSQGTIRIPVSPKSWLNLSARASYLNLFYDWLLALEKFDGLRYRFNDINADYNINLTDKDYLKVAFFRSRDNAFFSFGDSFMGTSLVWGNVAASVLWRHKMAEGFLEQRAYFSRYGNSIGVSDGMSAGSISSDIGRCGYNLARNLIAAGEVYLKYGVSFAIHDIAPFSTVISSDYGEHSSGPEPMPSEEVAAFLKAGKYIGERMFLECQTRIDAFHSDRMYYGFDPGISLTIFGKGYSDLKIQASMNHQYLHNLSIGEISLPAESWICAGENAAPQKSADVSLSYNKRIFGGVSVSGRIYTRKLFNQVENAEFLWSYLTAGASSVPEILVGDGYSVGAGFTLQKTEGRLTGMLSYNIGKSARRYAVFGDSYFPASHDRLHDLKTVVDYRMNDKISFSASWVYASGTPYTSPDCFYFIGGLPVCEYEAHNNARLPDFKRLDLSADFRIPTGQSCCGFVISAYNILFSSNPLIYRLIESNGHYSFTHVGFGVCMPVINFYVRF